MNRSVFSIILLALIGHLCVAEIVIRTSKPKHLTDLYDAAIDLLMTCHGDPGSAFGIVGDSDGTVLEGLRSKYLVPVVLINHMINLPPPHPSRLHQLQAFVIADGPREAMLSMNELQHTMWWNQHANFIFTDQTSNPNRQCTKFANYIDIPTSYGLLNAQFVCYYLHAGVLILNFNQFTSQAPPVWALVAQIRYVGFEVPVSVFSRRYRKGGRSCESLNFPKTIDIGGWPIQFLTRYVLRFFDRDNPESQKEWNNLSIHVRTLLEAHFREIQWFMDNIVRALNATAIVVPYERNMYYEGSKVLAMGISVLPYTLSSFTNAIQMMTRNMIFPLYDEPRYAVTQRTAHKSQLNKILAVIDENSRIGVYFVYVITFLFFKIFLRQAVMPALLNLMRLTCNTGLPNLPNDLASTTYLACLLMFVVTLQGIYTGNLATLLTTTIAYRNVQTKQDIPYLGYTVYTRNHDNEELIADPILHGSVVEIPRSEYCMDYVLREPLAACVETTFMAVRYAIQKNAQVSRDPIVHDYPFYLVTPRNPLGPTLESIMRRWVEHGLRDSNRTIENLRLLYVDDDEVKKNT